MEATTTSDGGAPAPVVSDAGGDAGGDAAPEALGGNGAAPEALGAEVLEAIEGDAGDGDGAATVTIGGIEIPIAALAELPDDVLGHIRRKVSSAGEEREISLLEALEAVPKADGWQRKQWEASQKIREVEDVYKRLRADPYIEAALRGDGDAALRAAEARVLDAYRREGMSDEQRAEADRMSELERKAERADEYEKRAREEAEAAQTTKLADYFSSNLKRSLEAAGVPPSDRTLKRAAEAMSSLIEGEGRDLTQTELAGAFGRVAEFVRDELEAEGEAMFDVSDDALIARIGDERARRIAKAYAARVRQAAPPPKAPAGSKPAPRRKRPRSFADLREELERKDHEGAW